MYMGAITELGIALADLVEDQAEWSGKTFGSDQERGPYGALVHLGREAREAWDAAMRLKAAQVNPGEWKNYGVAWEELREELADCLLLILDASRRSWIKPMQLIEAAQEKMRKNKTRTWPKPTSDEPVEHLK